MSSESLRFPSVSEVDDGEMVRTFRATRGESNVKPVA